MARVRVLLVDDEEPSRQRLADLLAEQPDLELVAACRNGPEAVDQILALRPELVFLDVQMPEMNGFEVIAHVGVELIPALVFVTAYDQYALRAFESRALDYLLKPFTTARFEEALARARRILAGDAAVDQQRDVQRLIDQLLPAPRARRLAARDGRRIVFLQLGEIDWIEGAGNYVRIHSGGRTLTMRATLRHTAERLRAAGFRRISHSVIVNLDRVASVERENGGNYLVLLHDGTRVHTSRSYADELTGML